MGSVMVFWVLGWGGAGCVWLFFGVFGGGAGCVCGGVGFGGVSVCGGTYYLPLSVRYALWCRFPFLGVENQPLGVVLGLWCGCERALVGW